MKKNDIEHYLFRRRWLGGVGRFGRANEYKLLTLSNNLSGTTQTYYEPWYKTVIF